MTSKPKVLKGENFWEVIDANMDELARDFPDLRPLIGRYVNRSNKVAEKNVTIYFEAQHKIAKTKGYTAAVGGDASLIELKYELMQKEMQVLDEGEVAVAELISSKYVIEVEEED
jgi:hypothetical protein